MDSEVSEINASRAPAAAAVTLFVTGLLANGLLATGLLAAAWTVVEGPARERVLSAAALVALAGGVALSALLFRQRRAFTALETRARAEAADLERYRALLQESQKLESIGQLAAGIAHEINTPVQFVGDNARFLQDAFRELLPALADLVRMGEVEGDGASEAALTERLERVSKACADADLDYLADEIPRAIEQSLEGTARVAKIVRAMRDYAHPGTAEKIAVDLNAAVETTVQVAVSQWKHVADVQLDLAADLPPVECLGDKINQVLLNLIVNATHAIGDRLAAEREPGAEKRKGRIVLSTRWVEDGAEIRVADNGGGIPFAAREHLFEPFFTTKEVGRGTGQGLAIAREVIVEEHGGSLTFETELGRGTTFVVRLPLVASQAQAPST